MMCNIIEHVTINKNNIACNHKILGDFNAVILPNDIHISLMSITCKLNDLLFNYVNIAKYIDLCEDCILSTTAKYKECDKNIIIRRSLSKNKKIKHKKVFFNQVSMYIFINGAYKHIKLFSNGSIQMTGFKTSNDVVELLSKLFDKLSVKKFIVDKNNNLVYVPFISNLQLLCFDNITKMQINMINTNFLILFCVDLKKFYEHLAKLNLNVKYRYEKINHPCINIKYINNNASIFIFVFENKSIVITGAKTYEQIFNAYKFINKILYNNYQYIVKKEINI